ncbi:MAG TPA: tetratricopeptide repeat protein [Granulicella sp.]
MSRSSLLLSLLLLSPLALHAQNPLPPGTTDTTQTPAPQPQDPMRAQAAEALQKQDFTTALDLLTTLTTRYPGDATLLYDLGMAQDALNHDTQAAGSYRRAIAADARLFAPHLALGLLLARTGNAPSAHAELAQATTLDAPAPALKARAWRALARLDQATDPSAASNDLLEALKLSPETPEDALLAGEMAEAAHDLPSAEAAYRRALATAPGDPATTAALAHVLMALHRAPEAETLLTASLNAHPGDPAMASQLAAAYAADNKADQAVPLIEKLHAANPADDNLTLLLAHLYTGSKQPEKAEPLYTALLAKSPHDLGLLTEHGENQLALGDAAAAQATLTQAVANPAAFKDRQLLGEAAGNLAIAASRNAAPEIVLHALEIRGTVLPQSPATLFLAATSYDALHRLQQASEFYKQFLAAAAGRYPEEESAARERLNLFEHRK